MTQAHKKHDPIFISYTNLMDSRKYLGFVEHLNAAMKAAS
jgi:hypothetical protein